MAKEYVKQAVSSDGTRTISAQRGFSWQRFLFSMGVDACINAYIGKMYLIYPRHRIMHMQNQF